MDTHALGADLFALDPNQPHRRPVRTGSAEDAYYQSHTPVERRIPRALPVIAALCLGFVAAGLLVQ